MKNRNEALAIFVFLLFILSLASSPSAGAQTQRWEFNITGGWVIRENPAIVMGFGYYLLPRFIALDINLAMLSGGRDDRGRELPLYLNLSLNLPVRRVVPFITGGGGYSLRGTFVKNVGAGVKLRLGRTMGFLAEYRYFWYTPYYPGYYLDTVRYNYIGVGLTRF